ncbi:hypothetical protein [Sessilibacter sp. MAH4]
MSKKWEGKTGKVFAKAESTIELKKVIACLGQEHFVEDDPMKTASGIERFWIFDVGGDMALAFEYCDMVNRLLIGTNRKEALNQKLLQRFISFPTKPSEGVMWE